MHVYRSFYLWQCCFVPRSSPKTWVHQHQVCLGFATVRVLRKITFICSERGQKKRSKTWLQDIPIKNRTYLYNLCLLWKTISVILAPFQVKYARSSIFMQGSPSFEQTKLKTVVIILLYNHLLSSGLRHIYISFTTGKGVLSWNKDG